MKLNSIKSFLGKIVKLKAMKMTNIAMGLTEIIENKYEEQSSITLLKAKFEQ